jgi:hypothetical protein
LDDSSGFSLSAELLNRGVFCDDFKIQKLDAREPDYFWINVSWHSKIDHETRLNDGRSVGSATQRPAVRASSESLRSLEEL